MRTSRMGPTGLRTGGLLMASLFLWACGDALHNPLSPDDPTRPDAPVARTDGASVPASPVAAVVAPTVVEGNPTCTDLGYDFGYKPQPEPPPSGTYTFPDTDRTVTITSDGTYFDWLSELGIDAVIVKGGPQANVYVYDPEAFSGTGLVSPDNAGGDPAAISHIDFCYDFEVDVEKTAETAYTQGYDVWEITKDEDGAYFGFLGETGLADPDHQYTITVTGLEPFETDWVVSGTITITNNTPFDATIQDVEDVLPDASTAPVECGVDFPHLLAAGADPLVCAYATGPGALAHRLEGLNTGTVSTSGIVGGGADQAEIVWADAVVTQATVDVTDDFATPGDSEEAAADDLAFPGLESDQSVMYPRDFDCSADANDYVDGVWTKKYVNTATIDGTQESDDATVTVTCYLPAKARVVKETVEGEEDIGQFPFTFELYAPGTEPGVDDPLETKTLDMAGDVTFDADLTDAGTWTVVEVDPTGDGWVNTDPSLECTFQVAFPGSAGQTSTCTFHNTEMSRVELLKRTDGASTTSRVWDFALYGGPDGFGGTPLATAATPPALLTFDGVNLSRLAAYTLCELGIDAGWHSEWLVDTDGDGTADTPILPYNPDDGEDLGNRCVDLGAGTPYALTPGEVLAFEVDNVRDGGDARTPGYWRNWSSCSNGNQWEKGRPANDPENHYWTLDELLANPGFTLGLLGLGAGDCAKAVAILNHRDVLTGQNRANDGAYALARNLLAYELNQAVGAYASQDAADAARAAHTLLLEGLEFTGSGGPYVRGKDARTARELAEILDDYNNNLLQD